MNLFSKIKTFFEEVLMEVKKIDWPDKKQTFRYVLMVIFISLALASFLGILDFLFMNLLNKFLF